VGWKETDLYIKADRDLTRESLKAIMQNRKEIEAYIRKRPLFKTSLEPLPPDPEAPAIIQEMLYAAEQAAVGPMAAVAGTIAESVGKALAAVSSQVIVENGGDIYLNTKQSVVVGLFSGGSPLNMRTGLRIAAEETPCGICTSSATVGPSLSLGQTDAVTVWASSTAVADAVATSLGNLIQTPEQIEPVLEQARDIPGIRGMVVVMGGRIGCWGNLDLVKLEA